MKKLLLFLIAWLTSLCCGATPLPAHDVFRITAKLIDPNTFVLNWHINEGYFLYEERIHLTVQNNTIHLGTIRFPKPLTKTDQLNRSFKIYRNQLNLPVAILGKHPGTALISFSYQGCADNGFCYPPEQREIELTINKELALTQVSLQELAAPAQRGATEPTPVNQIQSVFNHHSWLTLLFTFFGFGLLLSFTPCILPMVPVLSGIIVGQSDRLSTRTAFLLSLSYVLSMAVTYALVGAVVATLGSNLQIVMQSPWMIGSFSLVFVLLALSMFGFYDLKLPLIWQAKLTQLSRNQGSGHYLGAAIMGSLSILILSPCVTAPLIGALSYIAQSGDVGLGTLALFFLGLGMGTPLLIIGSSAGKWLPKAGQWMNAVKAFFGVLMLAVAIYLLSRILPGPLVMSLWAALLIFSGIYCGAFLTAVTHFDKFRQGCAIMLFAYGLIILVGASIGNTNPIQPLAELKVKTNYSTPLAKTTVSTVNELNQAMINARGKAIILDYYADWCTACQIMAATTFKDPIVEQALADFVLITVDVTANNAEAKQLLALYQVIAPPTLIFLDKQGKEQQNLRLIGEVATQEFLAELRQAKY